jgi:hypothetical protein
VVLCGVVMFLLLPAISQSGGASPPSDNQQGRSVPAATGPGYELRISNAVYGFNAPDVNNLPDNPTGDSPPCYSPQVGTCVSVGIASTGDYTSPRY